MEKELHNISAEIDADKELLASQPKEQLTKSMLRKHTYKYVKLLNGCYQCTACSASFIKMMGLINHFDRIHIEYSSGHRLIKTSNARYFTLAEFKLALLDGLPWKEGLKAQYVDQAYITS